MIMDMKPIRRLTASLLRHRAAPWLCALAVLVLTSCGDFFEFGEERATWDGKIICQNDSSVVMVLQPGEWAEYYLTVRFRDGRQGQVSNRVTVAAPANPPSTTEQ